MTNKPHLKPFLSGLHSKIQADGTFYYDAIRTKKQSAHLFNQYIHVIKKCADYDSLEYLLKQNAPAAVIKLTVHRNHII